MFSLHLSPRCDVFTDSDMRDAGILICNLHGFYHLHLVTRVLVLSCNDFDARFKAEDLQYNFFRHEHVLRMGSWQAFIWQVHSLPLLICIANPTHFILRSAEQAEQQSITNYADWAIFVSRYSEGLKDFLHYHAAYMKGMTPPRMLGMFNSTLIYVLQVMTQRQASVSSLDLWKAEVSTIPLFVRLLFCRALS